MLRLFAGIALPPEQRLHLSVICLGLPGAVWVDPGNFHMTLRFIGETDEGLASEIDDSLRRIRSRRFRLDVAGIGTFGTDSKPHTIYAGIERSEPLLLLQQRVESALIRCGLPPETRRYHPHVTLARLKRPKACDLSSYVAANSLLRLAPFEVREFCLVRSYLTKAGSIYEDIAAYPLAA